jgi:hypothetical protein
MFRLVAELGDIGNPEVICALGGAVNFVHVYAAGEGSWLPATSVNMPQSVYGPSAAGKVSVML